MAMIDYDPKILRAMFGKPIIPTIPISLSEISIEAQKLAGKLSISGVQPKLSVRLDGENLVPVERDGEYILKPQTQDFGELPQNEYLSMTMGRCFGLNTAPCILLELSDGSLAYVVRRFDRFKKGRRIEKLACEDIHQILGGPDKYAGSHEQIAQVIQKHCRFAPLEFQRLFEMTIFNFAIGNGDAHRKNFSLLTSADGNVALSPAYDLVSSRLVIPEEDEELALTVNGKRNRLDLGDFLAFADYMGIASDYARGRITALLALGEAFLKMISDSTLTGPLRDRLKDILADRLDSLQ
ncbi:MAG: HipA domain-containing protein [Phycisphaerales bacterium]|jgi:serine/threonine-protein kinase HipA|nr:HipA domain-containing protein [Phycisphaerales bacterium]